MTTPPPENSSQLPAGLKTVQKAGPWGRGRIYDDISQTIGQTPLVRLSQLRHVSSIHADILLKLEFFNPLSSVKDRIGVAMIDAMEESEGLKPGAVIIEPTSGNTGIGLAFVCARRAYNLVLVMPESMSIERRKLFRHLGAEVVLTPAELGMKGAIMRAEELLGELPGAVMARQFANPVNPLVHEHTTALEIWKDNGGQVDVLVAGVGTGGTLTGCGRFLRAQNPDLKIVAVEPENSAVLSGNEPGPHKVQGIGAGFVPSVLDSDLIDEVITITDESAFETAQVLARIEGITGGISTGANVAAAMMLAIKEEYRDKNIVTFAPSSADRYLSTGLFAPDPDEA
ncbi:MAG: cysteine synthase A [Hyphomicrobiaceae bacterium]|nr:cysteine synthase A [Hyphomicrobiaceae bacterium]